MVRDTRDYGNGPDEDSSEPVDDVTDEAATGITGTVSNSVVGANVGVGVSGTLAGALVGQLTADDIEEEASADGGAMEPIDLDALGAFAKGEDTGAVTGPSAGSRDSDV